MFNVNVAQLGVCKQLKGVRKISNFLMYFDLWVAKGRESLRYVFYFLLFVKESAFVESSSSASLFVDFNAMSSRRQPSERNVWRRRHQLTLQPSSSRATTTATTAAVQSSAKHSSKVRIQIWF